ncbi:MAG: hypothetical protein MAG715_01322 [Methanonatronarchaeales archaeon]|nr:hypothetical protein [Methanonatronarchaeales archaeon]
MPGFDEGVLRFLLRFRSPLITQVSVTLTALGSLPFGVVLVSGLLTVRARRLARAAGLGVLLAGMVTYSIKLLIRRPRPQGVDVPLDFVPWTSAFPSAHAAVAFALAYLISREAGGRWFFYSVAGMVAFTRVYLGVHYPSDVMVGAGIGLISGWAVVRAGF